MSTTALLTLEQFERIEWEGQLELLKGELIRLPPPQRPHMEGCEELYKTLDAAVARLRKEQPTLKLGKVHFEMGYLLRGEPRTWLRPDVSITYPDQPGKRYYEGAPLIVFEIVSEWDTEEQLAAKVAQFLANGAREVWVIYPDTREAWLHNTSDPPRLMKSIQSALLPGIEITLDEILK